VRRHLVTLICGISLIFCLGTLLLRLHAVAVADYLHCDSYRLKSGLVYRSKWDLESAGGQLGLWFSQDSNSDPKIVGGTLEFLPHAGYLPLREAAWSWRGGHQSGRTCSACAVMARQARSKVGLRNGFKSVANARILRTWGMECYRPALVCRPCDRLASVVVGAVGPMATTREARPLSIMRV